MGKISNGKLNRGLRKELAYYTKRGRIPAADAEVREREAELLASDDLGQTLCCPAFTGSVAKCGGSAASPRIRMSVVELGVTVKAVT